MVELPRGTGPAADVIHDLGYRHYDGPRLGRRAVWQALYVESTRGAYGLGRTARAKVVPLLCLAVVCLPALIVSVVSAVTGADELPVSPTSYLLNLQVVVAVFVAAQAPVAVSRDLRFGTVPLYFARPLLRSDYVSAKLAAFATALLVLLAAPLLLLLAGALLAEMPLGEQLPTVLRALAGAVLLAGVLAALGLAIAALTPRRGIGVAAIITVLLVLAGVQGIVQAIGVEEDLDGLAGWSQLLSPFTLVDGVQRRLLGAESVLPGGPPGTLGAVVFCAAAVALPLLCWLVLLLRYRRVRTS